MRRSRLSLVVAALALAVVGLSTLFVASRIDDRLAAARLEDRRLLASVLAVSHAHWFDAALADAASAASAVEPFDGSPEGDAAAVEVLEVLGSIGILDAVLVVSSAGTVRAADPGSTAQLGRPHRGAHIDAALAGASTIGAPQVDADGVALISAAVPLHDAEGRLSGALVGLFSAPPSDLPATSDVTALLVWQDGTVIESSGAATRDAFARAQGQRAAAGPGVDRGRDASGSRVVAAYAPVTSGWAVSLVEPAGSFDAGRSRPLLVTAIALLTAIGAAALIVTVQQRRLRSARNEVEDAKRALLAVAGHELRTPVTVVAALGQTLERRWDDLSDEDRRELVLTVGRHARTLRHLVERLMFAARLAARSSLRIEPRNTDLVPIVERAVDAHAGLAPTHRFEIHADGPVEASADGEALDQVLFHLLENAVRFSPGGGTVRVRVTADPRPCIRVEDEGVGLPADTDRLFDRFGQLEEVDTRVLGEGGVGLGLYIVRSILEAQNATISATNRPDGGACFGVVLPGPT